MHSKIVCSELFIRNHSALSMSLSLALDRRKREYGRAYLLQSWSIT